MDIKNNLFSRQTDYTLKMYKCIPTIVNGSQVDNLVEFQVDKPFILLHAFVVKKTDSRDRYSDLTQGMTNALLFLDPHPIVQIMNVANVSSFHIAPNLYYVQDLRPAPGSVDSNGLPLNRDDYEQYVYVLVCTNF
ncbi:hypothetical protein SAMN05444362_102350 [Dysgonomonas macrotermitis]|uniref:Uncharacterized protein n=2 Tax=Dysgonomonas macrotermitis TaxID=1346286 RepID=A0A1M4WY34_9BACT|nr:hypothetical protein SAMN05444362_102350 [Dysgonomonas macrotermitis]